MGYASSTSIYKKVHLKYVAMVQCLDQQQKLRVLCGSGELKEGEGAVAAVHRHLRPTDEYEPVQLSGGGGWT